MESTDPDMLADEIRRFLEEQNGDNEDSIPDVTSNHPDPPSGGHYNQSRSSITVNFNDSHADFDLDVSPDEIKKKFNIRNGTLTLTRRRISYKESDNEFEPDLVPGTYILTVTEPKVRAPAAPKRAKTNIPPKREEEEGDVIFYSGNVAPFYADIDPDKNVYFDTIDIFKDRGIWTSAFVISESDGKLTRVTERTNIPSQKGEKYTLLFYAKEKPHQQLRTLHKKTTIMTLDSDIKSLSKISMASAIIYWIAFPRIFFVLSRIESEFPLNNDIKDFKFLICPRSLKASLFQMAVSINFFVKLQILNAANVFRNRQMRATHFSDSLSSLTKLRSETNDFINAIMGYLRENKEEESTILLISKLRELEQQDKRVENEEEEYKKKKSTKELIGYDVSKIFCKDENPENDLQQLISQRFVLKTIFESVEKMITNENFDITEILNLLKLLKELICNEISHFLHMRATYEHDTGGKNKSQNQDKGSDESSEESSEEDLDEDLSPIKEHYESLYQMWRLTGAAYPLTINFSQQSDNWDLLKDDIINIQRITETSFHELMNESPLKTQKP